MGGVWPSIFCSSPSLCVFTPAFFSLPLYPCLPPASLDGCLRDRQRHSYTSTPWELSINRGLEGGYGGDMSLSVFWCVCVYIVRTDIGVLQGNWSVPWANRGSFDLGIGVERRLRSGGEIRKQRKLKGSQIVESRVVRFLIFGRFFLYAWLFLGFKESFGHVDQPTVSMR